MDDGVGGLVAEFPQVGPQSDAVGLVHADVDALGAVRRRRGGDHPAQEGIRLLAVGQEDLPVVRVLAHSGPVEHLPQVAQGLDAGHELDAQQVRVVVQPAQLLHGVLPPLVAEIGLLRHLVGVLGVHHAHVHAHEGHGPQKPLDGPHPQYRVPGDVEHHPRLKAGPLGDLICILLPVLPQEGQRPVEVDGLVPAQADALRPLLHHRARCTEHLHRRAALPGGEAQQGAQLQHGPGEALRQFAAEGQNVDLLAHIGCILLFMIFSRFLIRSDAVTWGLWYRVLLSGSPSRLVTALSSRR